MFRLQHKLGVLFAALATTAVAVLWAQFLVWVLLPPEVVRQVHVLPALIVVMTALPLAYFVWLKVRANENLSRELQLLVDRDRLTKVASRDYFFKRMDQFPDATGTALMVDIDHFKTVNDTFGHFAGDEVIRTVAQMLMSFAGQNDLVCRFGGEEFMVFLYDRSPAEAYDIAEQMRGAIAEKSVVFDGCAIEITVSIGGAGKNAEHPIAQAIREADIALYHAKNTGRNRTVVPTNSPFILQSLH